MIQPKNVSLKKAIEMPPNKPVDLDPQE